jgi:hypothetical protein
MANKWNTTDIEKISTAFVQKTIETCFQEKTKMSGEQIVTATEYPQINYFVLREIFNRWETETARFKSAFFDFENPEVQKSFTEFKNTLSRYISVDKEGFKELLNHATKKTLELYLQPEAFFVSDFRNLPDFKLSQSWLVKNSIFFKDYNWVIESLSESLGSSDNWIYANQALEDVKNLLKNRPEDFTETVNAIAREAGFELEEEPKVEVKPKVEENDNLSFFERLVANPPRPTSTFQEPEISAFDRIVSRFPKEEVAVTITEPVHVAEVLPVIDVPKPVIEEVAKPVIVADKTAVVVETKSVFDGLSIPTLNDRLSSSDGNSLSDVHQRSRIESLKGSMTLNQRFSFLNSLFAADLVTFENALNEVEKSTDFEQAREVLNANYSSRFSWNTTGDDYLEFMNLVKRRFS